MVKDLQLSRFKSHQAMGTLVAVEGNEGLPIALKRVFYVYGSDANTTRGEHAHKECAQVLVCVNGKCVVECDDGANKKTFTLDRGDEYLLIPPGIWASERYATAETVLLVFADKSYDPNDYIRNYDAFLEWRGTGTFKKVA